MTQETRSQIPKNHRRASFSAGARIFAKGDPASHAFYIESGLVEISRELNGRKIVLGVIGDGGIFGEMALIDRQNRAATATALADTTCVMISEQKVQTKMKDADPIIRSLMTMFVDTIRYLNDRTVEAELGRASQEG